MLYNGHVERQIHIIFYRRFSKMRNNKKGFTIVELVIVIAVIGILAAVLIPTFGSVVENAQRSGALQEAKVGMEMVSMEENAQLKGKYYIICEEYVFEYDADGKGITNQKPDNFTKEDSPKEQKDMITAVVTTKKLNDVDITFATSETKYITYFVSATHKDETVEQGKKTWLEGLGIEEKAADKIQIKYLEDFSENIVVIGLGEVND